MSKPLPLDPIMKRMHQGKTTVKIGKELKMLPQDVHDHVVKVWKIDKDSATRYR